MNIKRSYFKLLTASAAVGLFLANCTVKNSSDDSCEKGDKDVGCACPGGLTGYQVCDDGVFGACVCPDDNSGAGTSNTSTAGKSNTSTGGTNSSDGGEPASTGGKTYTAGTDAGGVAAVNAGAGGEGGEGGAPLTFDPVDCEDCLGKLCAAELDTCLDDTICADQYAAVIGCIDDERAVNDGTAVVKRDVVRACGVTVGSSPTVSGFPDWAPIEMDPKTTDLLNCMATAKSDPQGPNPDWANDLNNFPSAGPTPWPADSCAKLSCTSKF
jgi:hypothetical protein